MANNPSTLPGYNGQTAAPDADYTYGSARNDVSPGDLTGTPRVASEINDIMGFQQALLNAASIVPSGSPDTVLVSQYLEALQRITDKRLTVAQAKNDLTLKTGMFIFLTDRFATFLVVTGETPNELDIIDHGILSIQFELFHIGTIDVEALGGGASTGDNSPAIARLLDISLPGNTIRARGGPYNMTTSVAHSFGRVQDGVQIEFSGNFIFASDNGFDLKDFQQGDLKLGFVSHQQLAIDDGLASIGVGVTLSSFWSVEVDIIGTTNFLVGTKLVGGDLVDGSGNGMAFNDIKIRNAKAPVTAGGIGCLVTTIPTGTTPGFFNENHLRIGFLRCEKGVVFQKGSLQTDVFNGNKLWEPQIEGATKTGLELEFFSGNIIHHPRFEGGAVPSDWWIDEKADCSRNDYYITGPVSFDKFNFQGTLQNFFGRLVSDSGGLIANQLWGGNNTSGDNNVHDLYMSLLRGTNTPNNTVSWGGIPGETRWQRFAGTVRTGAGVDKVFGQLDPFGQFNAIGVTGDTPVPLGISFIELSTTGAGTVTLQMAEDREINGMTITMNLTFFTQQIEVEKSTGAVVINTGVITATGLYMFVYRSDIWRVQKIGEKLTP